MVGNDLHVAVVAGSEVWVWLRTRPIQFQQMGSRSSAGLGQQSSIAGAGLVAVATATINLVALGDGKLFVRRRWRRSGPRSMAGWRVESSVDSRSGGDPNRPVSDYLAVVRIPAPDHFCTPSVVMARTSVVADQHHTGRGMCVGV
jgi:hypothetical protein